MLLNNCLKSNSSGRHLNPITQDSPILEMKSNLTLLCYFKTSYNTSCLQDPPVKLYLETTVQISSNLLKWSTTSDRGLLPNHELLFFHKFKRDKGTTQRAGLINVHMLLLYSLRSIALSVAATVATLVLVSIDSAPPT